MAFAPAFLVLFPRRGFPALLKGSSPLLEEFALFPFKGLAVSLGQIGEPVPKQLALPQRVRQFGEGSSGIGLLAAHQERALQGAEMPVPLGFTGKDLDDVLDATTVPQQAQQLILSPLLVFVRGGDEA